jgi:bifunctional DNA-binding transcriptional regulator/antitoxin component of YhaV-PrlF toxin-antitoxin module
MEFKTQMDKQGRIPIPYNVRKELKFHSGDSFVVRLINGELHLVSLDKVIEDAQAFFKTLKREGESMVDDFLKQKKEDYELEESKSLSSENNNE